MFEQILTRFEGLRVDGDPYDFPRVNSNLIDGFAELPITWDRIPPGGLTRPSSPHASHVWTERLERPDQRVGSLSGCVGGQAFTSSTSRWSLIFSETSTPPPSRATFHSRPQSLRLISPSAVKPARVPPHGSPLTPSNSRSSSTAW